MSLERHAKAIAAFATALAAPAIFAALAGATHPMENLAALILGAFTGILTGVVVYAVPNKTHGYNVNDIADSLIQAGFDAVAEQEDPPLHDSQHP